MYKCEECNLEFNTFQEKANHHRWKHLKYMYKNDDTYKQSKDKKESNWEVFSVKCYKCDKEFDIKEFDTDIPKKEKYYCSRSCANTRHHTEESKLKISKKLKIILDSKICLKCNSEFIPNRKSRKFCSTECVNEYKKEYYRKNRTELQNYKKDCQFEFNLKYYPDEFEFDLIKENGWYKAKNHGDNLGGISRDHMFSINEGFKMNINPEIIKHPANCKLMIHNENSAKWKGCSITLEELKERIDIWNKKYK